ncbi:hypothetical protein THAOC_06844 [Thalassiosira oceanica]|uniref:USP domain-containing protein n=1 Tax=Thalassiosira oceanica TaxID=159749 RepID=K0T1T1_THAOC|nr:hypothetical protein THAOC_06844 [Thalassiosira oceanica]|eukprot:EJK71690.1 hypothetical protein THAOC_06844 [Thalassiosira oceanica]
MTSSPHAGAPAAGDGHETACPYLDTINRPALDFDAPDHACSVTLDASPHIYACLVCGKFFRGRGRQTPAYTHAVEEGHYVFVHLTNGTFWCLPDGYEVPRSEPSLRDIGLALHPKFEPAEVAGLDGNDELARDLFGRRYLPGFVGLNNLSKTDYLNAVVQALAHVRPLRDYFLLAPNFDELGGGAGEAPAGGGGKRRLAGQQQQVRRLAYSEFSPLARSFSLLLRNMWSSHRFKSNVDPHMLVQAVSAASNKRYHVGRQAEAGEFLAWLLHQLHVGTGGSVVRPGKKKKKKKNRSKEGGAEGRATGTAAASRGEGEALKVMNQVGTSGAGSAAKLGEEEEDDDDRAGSDDEATVERKQKNRAALKSLADEMVTAEEETVTETDFLQLTLDIPEKPLFKDKDGGLVIPQEPLVNVLRKFDGVSFSDVLASQQQPAQSKQGDGTVVSRKRRYKLKRLPNYLILHLSRFKKNGYFIEKNPTIVMFPVKNFDLSQYVFPEGGRDSVPSEAEVRDMSVRELKALLTKYGRSDLAENSIEKDELVSHAVDFVTTSLPDLLADKYDLVANITHELPVEVGREGKQRDPLEEGSYRCHVQHRATGQWYEMQDLSVKETMPQLIGVSESYLLIFERKGAA